MHAKEQDTRRRGVLATDVVASIVLMGLIAALTAKGAIDYHHLRDHYTFRQAAAWAADAQWQRYRAGAAIDSPPPDGLIPETITLETTVEPGHGGWQGFRRVTVVATARLPTGQYVHEEVSGYLPGEIKP